MFNSLDARIRRGSHLPGLPIVAAPITNFGASPAEEVVLSGNATITKFVGRKNSRKIVRLTGVPTITHNATSLISPTGGNIQGAPNDVMMLQSDSYGNWRIVNYLPYGGIITASFSGVSVLASAGVVPVASPTIPPGTWRTMLKMGTTGSGTYFTFGIDLSNSMFTGTFGIDYLYAAMNGDAGGGVVSSLILSHASSPVYYALAQCTVDMTVYGSFVAERII